MIIEGIISLVVEAVVLGLQGFKLVGLPMSAIQTLGTLACYGSYVVGADLLLIFSGCVMGWATFKMTMGITLFVWRLLPLT